jgi:hypothetical protein
VTERDLIGTWQKVAYGDMPTEGRHLLHLRPDGVAVTEGEYRGEQYHTQYAWRLTGPNAWELRRVIPLGEIPEMDEESVEVLEYTVVEFDGQRMAVTKFDCEEPFIYKRLA